MKLVCEFAQIDCGSMKLVFEFVQISCGFMKLVFESAQIACGFIKLVFESAQIACGFMKLVSHFTGSEAFEVKPHRGLVLYVGNAYLICGEAYSFAWHCTYSNA